MAERVWAKILKDKENNSLKKIYYDMKNIAGEEIVSPDYGIIDKEKYLYTNIISTSRGCPFQCDFCYNSSKNVLKTYVNRPIDHVIKDINVLKTRHIRKFGKLTELLCNIVSFKSIGRFSRWLAYKI